MIISTSGVYVNVKIDDWRVALYPGMSFRGIPEQYRDILESVEVQDYCKTYWTEEKIEEWEQIKAESITEDPPPLTDSERIDAAFPKTDTAQVLFEALFELSNRIMTLEGKKEITREQLKDWLKAKLPT